MSQVVRRDRAFYYRVGAIIFASFAFSVAVKAGTNFYVDPDWTGAKTGTQSQPFAALDKSAWQKINTALANDKVTIYFSALKADGATQQSKPWFIQCRRTDYGPHRLSLDGYSFYNSSERSANWLPNPDPDINHAYQNGKVFKSTGDGSQALGWNRNDGNDFVRHNGVVYCCIESHLASSDNEPGVGPNWTLYWDQHGTRGANWSAGNAYKCYVKQNNVTLRGFECTGSGARVGATGDNLIYEYTWIHDVTGIGPGLQILYTSFPDSSLAQIISRPSTNLVFRNFRIERTYGEGFYLGAINPDAPAAFQVLHGNQHSHILIENFLIDHPGANGGQGDGIDCKNGITYLTIRLGEIKENCNNGNGINVPMTATNVNQSILIERNLIHDPIVDNTGAEFGIYAAADQASASSLYGFNGVTIRNNIVANMRRGIQYTGDITIPRPAINGYIFNNTVYNISADAALAVGGWNTSTGCVVENNFAFAGTGDPRGSIDSVGVVSDYNAHDGNWISSSEGAHTLALSTTQASAAVVNATRKDFHPSANSPLKGKALTISSFSDDFYQRPRAPDDWNIGAVQMSGDSPGPRSASMSFQ